MTDLKIPVGPHDHARGPATAPLTLVEYADYECPYCATAHAIVEQLRAAFGDQLRVVFRNFPLTQVHPHALAAAEAAEFAGKHGKFWEMYDHLFAHQDRLATADLVAAAGPLGLDGAALATALKTRAGITRLEEELKGGLASGVQGTPTFFINGQRHEGAWEYADLEAALQRAGGRISDR